jgi:hypothetical protein
MGKVKFERDWLTRSLKQIKDSEDPLVKELHGSVSKLHPVDRVKWLASFLGGQFNESDTTESCYVSVWKGEDRVEIRFSDHSKSTYLGFSTRYHCLNYFDLKLSTGRTRFVNDAVSVIKSLKAAS